MIIETVSILAGHGKDKSPEPTARVDLRPGDSLALVGPTGSGKSELLADIGQAAHGDTRSGRTILVNGHPLDEAPQGMVATLSQKTNFVMDASVREFILLHAESQGRDGTALLPALMDMANGLCGEPVTPEMPLQVLSGGQSRALMIADIALLSDSPVVLIDELENAGIHKFEALNVLAGRQKVVISATHDPVLILMNDARLVMRNGAMDRFIPGREAERDYAEGLRRMDKELMRARDALRRGEVLGSGEAAA